MSPQALNLLVFREGRTESSAESLKTALAQQLADLRDERSVIRALLRAERAGVEQEGDAGEQGSSHENPHPWLDGQKVGVTRGAR